MPEISEIEFYDIPAQPVLSIREVMPFSEFPIRAESAFTKILAYLTQSGRLPAGGPFVCYHNTDLEHLDVEIGFPVFESLPERDDIHCVIHPGGRCAAGIFQGPYEESDPLMLKIMEAIAGRGQAAAGRIYNEYLNDTRRPPHNWLLRIRIPIR